MGLVDLLDRPMLASSCERRDMMSRLGKLVDWNQAQKKLLQHLEEMTLGIYHINKQSHGSVKLGKMCETQKQSGMRI